MSLRVRALVAVVVVVVAATVAYVAVRVNERSDAAASALESGDIPHGPLIVFRNTTVDGTNGQVAAVPLGEPGSKRVSLGVVCDRVDVVGERLACLSTNRGMANTFQLDVYDGTDPGDLGDPVSSWPVPGIPSRTRLSPSGRLVAATVFVSGHSYLQVGFSTATVIREVGGEPLGNLEKWDLTVDGRPLRAVDRNFWGVTFVDDSTFYATAASGERTWLVKGDIAAREMTALQSNAECPSVSPDRSKVAYKRLGADDEWSVAVLDVASGEETLLPATAGLDDQVTWLDDETLLYGLPREGSPGVSDIWRVGIGDGSTPESYIENAWSPAVVS